MPLQSLHEQGFDKSYCIEGTDQIKVKCSQCEALVINGVPCHENGCPNRKHARQEDELDPLDDDRDQENPVESANYDNYDWDNDPDWR